MTTEEMDGVLDAIDAGRRIKVIRGDLEAAMRNIGVDPESGLKVCVEREDSRGEVWRVYAPTEELTLAGEGGVVVGSKVAVVVSNALELELEGELRAKELVRVEFVVVTEGGADGDEGDERLVVWVKERSHLWLALVELIAGVLKQKEAQEEGAEEPMDTGVPKDAQEKESEGATAPMDTEVAKESEEPMAPMETEVAIAPKKKKETEVAMEPKKKKETEVAMEPEGPKPQEPMDTEPMAPMDTEPMAAMAAMETKVPKTQETKAEKAARLMAKAREAAEAALEAEREAEEEAAAERESEREETKRALKRARQELERVRDEVEGLERQLKQQNDVERRKRKRMNQGESPSRRVAARKEKEDLEIVMVPDREFREAVGVYGGAVHHAWVGRFEPYGPGGMGPVRGGEMVLESVYGGGAKVDELLARFAKRKGGTDVVVVVREFKDVKEFDAWMEENEFVKRTIDVELRCMNPEGPMEPECGDDTERVWVKRGSAELAALDKLIAKARSRKLQWQCPESPRSPVYACAPRSPVDDGDDDDDHDETSCVD
jgi:hypothetical protein